MGLVQLGYFLVLYYIILCAIVTQYARIYFKAHPTSAVPLYLTLFPFMAFTVLSLGNHQVLSGLWFASIMAITLQLGSSKLDYHIIGISVGFIFMYVLCVFVISPALNQPWFISNLVDSTQVYYNLSTTTVSCLPGSTNQTCFCPFLYSPETNNTNCLFQFSAPVAVQVEITYIVSMVLLCLCACTLQRHIREYAFNLVDRQYEVMSLSNQNADLRNQLQEIRKDLDFDLDLDSPITKVIKVIRDIQATRGNHVFSLKKKNIYK